jgi:hypothetical protein
VASKRGGSTRKGKGSGEVLPPKPRALLWLGEPDRSDVESAAQLLVRYRAGGITEDGLHMFITMLSDPHAVRARAKEIESEELGGHPREDGFRGGPGADVKDLPPDFVGLIDEHGKVLIDDTSYFRIQAEERPIREGFDEATRETRARLEELMLTAADERRGKQKRVGFMVELDSAISRFEWAARDYAIRVHWEAKRKNDG